MMEFILKDPVLKNSVQGDVVLKNSVQKDSVQKTLQYMVISIEQ